MLRYLDGLLNRTIERIGAPGAKYVPAKYWPRCVETDGRTGSYKVKGQPQRFPSAHLGCAHDYDSRYSALTGVAPAPPTDPDRVVHAFLHRLPCLRPPLPVSYDLGEHLGV